MPLIAGIIGHLGSRNGCSIRHIARKPRAYSRVVLAAKPADLLRTELNEVGLEMLSRRQAGWGDMINS